MFGWLHPETTDGRATLGSIARKKWGVGYAAAATSMWLK